ncbi:MAG TPA: ATP-binding protein, partial [Cyclobacteriaceae bacterium]|nr:ATP-binding protein [Cyclobacteriaceae bacterium]
ETINLNDTVSEAVRDLDVPIREKNAMLIVGNLPSVQANKTRLRQLFSNLISNSLKYSRRDLPPRIEVTSVVENDRVVITIRDNGIGFDDNFSEKIFGLFERLHTRDQYPGTGIGLSICKRIVELHQGSISATSIPGEFALFTVKLPLNQVQQA